MATQCRFAIRTAIRTTGETLQTVVSGVSLFFVSRTPPTAQYLTMHLLTHVSNTRYLYTMHSVHEPARSATSFLSSKQVRQLVVIIVLLDAIVGLRINENHHLVDVHVTWWLFAGEEGAGVSVGVRSSSEVAGGYAAPLLASEHDMPLDVRRDARSTVAGNACAGGVIELARATGDQIAQAVGRSASQLVSIADRFGAFDSDVARILRDLAQPRVLSPTPRLSR